MPQRKVYQIARDIPPAEVPHYAQPYYEAMCEIGDINSMYGADTAKSVVLYFLSNAQTWRGPTARQIKAELKELVK